MRHNEKGFHPIRLGNPLPQENWPYHGKPHSGFDPRYGDNAPKFEKHIFVRKDQIMADISMQLDMISNARRKPDGTEDNTLSDATTRYESQFLRWLDLHIGVIKSTLSAFLLEEFRKTQLNSISKVDEIDFELRMPEFWDDTVFESLTKSLHDYLVNAVMNEYLTISLTSKDPVTVDKAKQANDSLLDVKRFANAAKPGRIHKVMQPF